MASEHIVAEAIGLHFITGIVATAALEYYCPIAHVFYGELRWQDANLDTSTANGQKYVYWDSNSRL